MFDLVITGGTVVDGTGSAPYPADVAIQDGRIVDQGTHESLLARRGFYFDLYDSHFAEPLEQAS